MPFGAPWPAPTVCIHCAPDEWFMNSEGGKFFPCPLGLLERIEETVGVSSFWGFLDFTFLLTRISLYTPIARFAYSNEKTKTKASLFSPETVWISLRPYMSLSRHGERRMKEERWEKRDYGCDKYWNSGRGMSSAVSIFPIWFFFLFICG